jgi:hypothetical protein
MTPFVPRSKQKKINQHPTPKNKTKINDAEKKAPTELPQRKNERKKTDTGIHKQKISFPKTPPSPNSFTRACRRAGNSMKKTRKKLPNR